MRYIFTDIDGVLQIKNPKKWDKNCCTLYNKVCNDLGLKAVITSTWRVQYTIKELQKIFIDQGIDVEIVGVTDVLGIERGKEILNYIQDNDINEYVVIDDNVRDIVPFVENVVGIDKSYIGLTENNCNQIKKIFNV